MIYGQFSFSFQSLQTTTTHLHTHTAGPNHNPNKTNKQHKMFPNYPNATPMDVILGSLNPCGPDTGIEEPTDSNWGWSCCVCAAGNNGKRTYCKNCDHDRCDDCEEIN